MSVSTKGRLTLIMALMLIMMFAITSIASAAISVDSFVFKSGNEYLEFGRTALAYSYGQTDPALHSTYEAYAGQSTAVNTLKLSGNYYSMSALTFKYGQLSGDNKTFDNAVQNTTPVQKATRIAKMLNGATVYEGPIVSSTSSLMLSRTPGADSKLWDCAETTTVSNKTNPIGPINFIFAKNLDKQNLSNVSIYLNGVKPAEESLIKEMLFGEFYTRATDQTTPNSLDGDIANSYSQLKAALKGYNNDTDVTTVKIDVIATDNTTVSVTLNIK